MTGGITLDSSVTAGDFILTGVGTLENNSTSVTSLDISSLVNEYNTARAVWDEVIGDHLLPDTTGHQMYHQAYDGMVHVDVINGTSGTTFPTGTTHQPCDNLTDALSIANAHYFKIIHVVGDLEIDGEDITGYTIAADRSLGNSVTITSMVNTDACYFSDITVSGALSGSTRFTTCVLGDLTGYDGGAKNCLLTGEISITGDGANYFTECDQYVITVDTPVVLNVYDKMLNIIRGRGNFGVFNKTGDNLISFGLASGRVTIDSTCVAGYIGVAGIVDITDNSGPGCTVINYGLSNTSITGAVWDETLTAATHNIPTSAGRRLRSMASVVITEGEVTASTINTITLNGDSSSEDGAYDPAIIAISEGTGYGQCRNIFEYDGATHTAVVDRNWKIIPDLTSKYIISANAGREHVNEGLARGGSINTITLNAYASNYDNAYVGQLVFIRSGTGDDQVNHVTAYNGTTKVATVYHDWLTIPDTTSAYVMIPAHVMDSNAIANAVWDEPIADHVADGTTGKALGTASSGGVDYGLLADAIWNDNIVNRITENSAGLAMFKMLSELNNNATVVDNDDDTKTVTIWTQDGEPNIYKQYTITIDGLIETKVAV